MTPPRRLRRGMVGRARFRQRHGYGVMLIDLPGQGASAATFGLRVRVRLGPAGGPLSHLLLAQLPLRLGIAASELRPIERIGEVGAPLMIASGSANRHTTLPETGRLFAAAAEPKRLLVVQGAAHVDLHAFATTACEEKVGAFLERYLRP